MAFKYSCFISYPHNAGKSVDKFVIRLKEELADRFAQFVPDPIKMDQDFLTGADFNKAIAQAICESACLLVVYMPVYQRKRFCLQEYTMMERIQAARYEALKKDLSAQFGMILPLIYTGEESKIPKWISQRINYKDISKDISKLTTGDPEAVFDQQDFREWLLKIANMVDSLYNAFQASPTDSCVLCQTPTLPGEDDAEVTAKLNTQQGGDSFR